MTNLTGKSFKEWYLTVFNALPNPGNSPPPSAKLFTILYAGTRSSPGYKRFSEETFEELCVLAIQECKYMPAFEWFVNRAVQLSAPGREVVTVLSIAAAEDLDDPIGQTEIRRLIAEAEGSFDQARRAKEAKAKALVSGGVIDPRFTEWIEENVLTLRQRFSTIARRGGANRSRLIWLLQGNLACQLAYIESLDGPQDMKSACPNAQPLLGQKPQLQLAGH